VNKADQLAHDDDNDTALFEQWREQVIRDYPNPHRIGCLDPATLRTFVETPGALDLTDLKYLHIVECAECTKDLNELRQAREQRLAQSASRSERRSSARLSWFGWKTAVFAGTAVVLVAVLALTWRHELDRFGETKVEAAVQKTVDLSGDGASRGGAEKRVSISLPRRLVDLDLVLPFYSPAGRYRISLSKGRNGDELQFRDAVATANGPRTELRVQLDLRSMRPGQYFLGTVYDGDSEPSYYPFTLD
jgi:hypothetical protein